MDLGRRVLAVSAGGFPALNAYNNWDLASDVPQPSNEPNAKYVAIGFDGRWSDFPLDAVMSGMLCEYTGVPAGTVGSVTVEWQNCGRPRSADHALQVP